MVAFVLEHFPADGKQKHKMCWLLRKPRCWTNGSYLLKLCNIDACSELGLSIFTTHEKKARTKWKSWYLVQTLLQIRNDKQSKNVASVSEIIWKHSLHILGQNACKDTNVLCQRGENFKRWKI